MIALCLLCRYVLPSPPGSRVCYECLVREKARAKQAVIDILAHEMSQQLKSDQAIWRELGV